jgi:hypothetical protein
MTETTGGTGETGTKIIAAAGEILQTLTPMRLATLHYYTSDAIETQREIATLLDCTPSAITMYLKALANLPVPILTQEGTTYRLTEQGDEIIGALCGRTNISKAGLESINWQEETAMDQVAASLAPLHSSRGPLLFFVLHSLGVRTSVSDQIDLLNAPESIQVASIVADVEDRQAERGESVERQQVRTRLSNLAEAESLTISSQSVTLTEKGQDQARLFERIIRIVEESHANESSTERTEPESDPRNHATQGPSLDEGMIVSFDTDANGPTIVPAYCQQSDGDTVLRLTDSMTIDEFVESAARLRDEYDGDVELELNWTVWP